MSLVIAIKDKDRVILGADKQTSCGGTKTHDAVKVWELSEFPGAVMGSVGLLRVTQIIQTSQILELNDLLNGGGPSTAFIINSVVPRILNLLESRGVKCDATVNRDLDMSRIPNSFVLAVGDKVWEISTDLCVTEIENYVAIGSGEDVARGCLFATKEDKNPFKRISVAIDAAADSTLYVDRDIDFVATKVYKNDCNLLDKTFGFESDAVQGEVVNSKTAKPEVKKKANKPETSTKKEKPTSKKKDSKKPVKNKEK